MGHTTAPPTPLQARKDRIEALTYTVMRFPNSTITDELRELTPHLSDEDRHQAIEDLIDAIRNRDADHDLNAVEPELRDRELLFDRHQALVDDALAELARGA